MNLFDLDTTTASPDDLRTLAGAHLLEAGVTFAVRALDILKVEQTFRLTAIVAGASFSGPPSPEVIATLKSVDLEYEEASSTLLAAQADTGAALIRNSVLGMWQAFELFLGDSLTVLFFCFPRFLTAPPENITLPTLQFDDVFSAASLLEARRLIARRKVVSLVQSENVFDLIRNAEKRFGIKLSQLTDQDRHALLELAARRNLWIHNAGVVNDIYLRLLRRYGISTAFGEGAPAPLDHSYLQAARDLTRRAALAIATGLSDSVPQVYQYHASLNGA